MTTNPLPPEFRAARQPTDAEREALAAVAAKIIRRGVLAHLHPKDVTADVQARADATVAHLTGDQP